MITYIITTHKVGCGSYIDRGFKSLDKANSYILYTYPSNFVVESNACDKALNEVCRYNYENINTYVTISEVIVK